MCAANKQVTQNGPILRSLIVNEDYNANIFFSVTARRAKNLKETFVWIKIHYQAKNKKKYYFSSFALRSTVSVVMYGIFRNSRYAVTQSLMCVVMFDKEFYNNNCYYEVEVKKILLLHQHEIRRMIFGKKSLCDNVTHLNHNLAKKISNKFFF